MFVRTERLTLRPAWAEDAPMLAQAIGHEEVVRNLSQVPWPYSVEAAESYVRSFNDAAQPKFLIFEHLANGMRLIGGMGIGVEDDAHKLGYWLTPSAWGRGFATEAGGGVLRAARAAGVRRVTAGHFIDNPASGRVLRKLGFRPTGRITPVYSRGRGGEAPSASYAIDLGEGDHCGGADPDARMAA